LSVSDALAPSGPAIVALPVLQPSRRFTDHRPPICCSAAGSYASPKRGPTGTNSGTLIPCAMSPSATPTAQPTNGLDPFAPYSITSVCARSSCSIRKPEPSRVMSAHEPLACAGAPAPALAQQRPWSVVRRVSGTVLLPHSGWPSQRSSPVLQSPKPRYI